MKNDAHCRKDKYCDFKVELENPKVQVEVCIRCGKRVIYHKGKGGRIDNAKYLRDHVRHFAQPTGKTRRVFEEVYGRKVYLETLKMLKKRGKKQESQKGKYIKKTGWVDSKTKKAL